jgi:class 3 adenylate cyclase
MHERTNMATEASKPRRKLSAILMVDVSGFSRMMGRDEEGTTARIREFHLRTRSLVEAHEGRVVDTAGDAVFGEFDSIVHAVRCAQVIQHTQAAINAALRPEDRIETRIGVHLGDVIVQDYRVYGDGVNIAARLEAAADPGGICVSEAVYQQVRTKLDLTFEDLGVQALKNIDYPIRVYRVVLPQPGRQPLAERHMVPEPTSNPGTAAFLRVSDQEREATVQRLQTAFAEGRLNDEEFDARLRAALTARTQEELARLLADLPGIQARLAPARLMGRPVVAVLSEAVRRGRWRVPEQCTVVAVLGGCVLDLRAAQLSAPVTTITAVAIMGSVEVIVPPGVRVEIHGLPLMGGYSNRVSEENLPPEAPQVHIGGVALLGGVEVRTDQRSRQRHRHRRHRR